MWKLRAVQGTRGPVLPQAPRAGTWSTSQHQWALPTACHLGKNQAAVKTDFKNLPKPSNTQSQGRVNKGPDWLGKELGSLGNSAQRGRLVFHLMGGSDRFSKVHGQGRPDICLCKVPGTFSCLALVANHSTRQRNYLRYHHMPAAFYIHVMPTFGLCFYKNILMALTIITCYFANYLVWASRTIYNSSYHLLIPRTPFLIILICRFNHF